MSEVGKTIALIRALGTPTDAQVNSAVEGWLDDHPEATTTVEDGSITNAKLASSFVTPGTAAAYSSSATYAVGDYVFYGGTLYRCNTPITTAEAWTAAHWTAAVLGDDVSDLKNAFNYNKDYSQTEINEINGNISSLLANDASVEINQYEYLSLGDLAAGVPVASTNTGYTDFIDNSSASNPTYYYNSTTYKINIIRFNSSKEYIGGTGFLNIEPIMIRQYITDPYIRILIRRKDNADIDLSDAKLYTKKTISNNIVYSGEIEAADMLAANAVNNNAKANRNSILDILSGGNVVEEYHPMMQYLDIAAGSFVPSTNTLTSEVISNQTGKFYYYDSTNYKVNICYSSDGSSYSSTGFVALSSPFKIETYSISAPYIRISVRRQTEANIESFTEGGLYTSYTAQNNIAYTENTHSVTSGDSLLEGVQYCYANNKKKLIVEAGTYDVISEYETKYGADYFTNYTSNYNGYTNGKFDAGIWLENIEVVFNPGAKVVAYYEGNNQNVKDYFSAFATGNNVTIDGLVLDASELRYGIHADFNSGSLVTTFTVKNSDLHHYKPSAQSNDNQAIGAGLGEHVRWSFENCIFRSDGEKIVLRIHNNVSSSSQSQILLTNCYFVGNGFARFNSYSTSTKITQINVSNCSWITAPVLGKETQASNDNFTLLAWNNETRQS